MSTIHKNNTIVLSLPRGGVVVGATVAKILGLPHDIAVVCYHHFPQVSDQEVMTLLQN